MKRVLKATSLFLLMAVSLTSCLKDDMYALDPSRGHNVIEFLNITRPVTGYNDPNVVYIPKTFETVAEDVFEVGINFAGPEDLAPTDIVVNLALAPDVATNAGYEPLAANLFSGLPASVTIPKGQKKVIFPITVKPASFDLSKSNAIAIRIVSTSYGVVSGNVGTAIFSLPVKNPYDGIYKIEDGWVLRYSNPTTPTTGDALNGSLVGNPNLTLTTINATTCEIGNLRWAGGTSGVAGIDNLRLTVDPATNEVTMFAVGNATLANRPGLPNVYDPATKTFTLNFDWNQTSTKREIELVIKWVASR